MIGRIVEVRLRRSERAFERRAVLILALTGRPKTVEGGSLRCSECRAHALVHQLARRSAGELDLSLSEEAARFANLAFANLALPE